jgi:Ca2+-binding RTX toxin-like protein
MTTRIFTGASGAGGPAQIALATLEGLIITRGALLALTDNVTGITGSSGGHVLAINGDVATAAEGLSLSGDGNRVTIAQGGSITSGLAAITIQGNKTAIVNHGEITALDDLAIQLSNLVSTDGPLPAGRVSVFNGGIINGGIAASGSALELVNRGQILLPGSLSISSVIIAGGALADAVSNSGTIRGSINLSEGNNTLVNRGTIMGDVVMGLDADTVDNRLGLIDGASYLLGGDDSYRPGAENDIAYGGEGKDMIDFSRAGPVRFALDGSVDSTGPADGDSLIGFENLRGSLGGDDLLVGNVNDNVIEGMGGNDDLRGSFGADTLSGGTGNDQLAGGTGADQLNGGAGNDKLFGDDGADQLLGGEGNDGLTGGKGADTLNGGAGFDILTGGTGADVFQFGPDLIDDGSTVLSRDKIKDFSAATGDMIDFSAIDAISGTPGDDPFTFIGATKFSNVAGQLRYAFGSFGATLVGDVDGDGTADFTIEVSAFKITQADHLVL